MKTVYYTASSLDGFIVDTDDSLDLADHPQHRSAGPIRLRPIHHDDRGAGDGFGDLWVDREEPARRMDVRAAGVGVDAPAADRRRRASGAGVLPGIAEQHRDLVEAAAGRDIWVVGEATLPHSTSGPG